MHSKKGYDKALVKAKSTSHLKPVHNTSSAVPPKQSADLAVMHQVEQELNNAGYFGLASTLIQNFIKMRSKSDSSVSYTAFLAQSSPDELSRLLVDEAVKVALKVSGSANHEEIVLEATNLYYHLLVMLETLGIKITSITDEILERIIDSKFKTDVFKKLRDKTLLESDVVKFISDSILTTSKKDSKPTKLQASTKKAIAKNAAKPKKLAQKKPTKLKSKK